ncbi:chromosome segregation protein SMC (plasmid) [Aminobacter sp. Y103A]|uniref:AAA family ATPase n=1 Tax=Aminobacter sp. Y103A TaxID=1870862 RepID=UPI0025726B36|nr:AAA family ATPase [Aminobacter sp. SS-2016]BBD41310.1 chromosome segregation protein SMC [Aminobacter sp. SS-2016]
MKVDYVEASGFRGYRDPVRIDFASGFTVIDGRNGVGKSTIFDAVEFALTGELSKYKGATAAGQSVADYFWWIGEGDAPKERYVEVGFSGSGGTFKVRRTPLDASDVTISPDIVKALAHPELAPKAPLEQLCATAIIRDEHIAGLSLDLKETERYALLRQAIGANDADSWIARALDISTLAKRRREAAQGEVNTLTAELAATARRLDELRSSLASDSAIAEATTRLRLFADTTATPDSLTGAVRHRMAAVDYELGELSSLRDRLNQFGSARASLPNLYRELSSVQRACDEAERSLAAIVEVDAEETSGDLARRARDLVSLIAAGRNLGLIEHHCPLCSASHTEQSFQTGSAEAEAAAGRIDEIATAIAQREEQHRAAAKALSEQKQRQSNVAAQIAAQEAVIHQVEEQCRALGIEGDPSVEDIDRRAALLGVSLENAQRDLRILDTLRLNSELAKAMQAEQVAKERLARGQERFGRARKAEATAAALHDATRRAAAETLDLRLDRVLPLMAELYQRLKPHPVWQDIEYAIRGDVRRFLSLKVGDGLNPQFLFSSGQRRATGLAFLLSINLSLAWSRWQTVLLDDPVQHVDDFRTVHLAEVLAQLVEDGRQIICAVEDPALADLMCRRLPVKTAASGRRITLGPGADGALSVRSATWLKPLPARAFAEIPQTRTG